MHESVLLKEAISYLNIKENSVIVDCTLGYAGHSLEILKRIKRGFLFAFDQDKEAIDFSYKKLKAENDNFKIIKTNFVNIKEALNNSKVDGILYDLGVSSPQLDTEDRGFSFHKDAHLDMRMDKEQALDAYQVVNNYTFEELKNIIYKYGDEKFAGRIAKQIVIDRENKKIETTLELVETIKKAVPFKYQREKHPARKTFQAIRIEVNNELENFEKSLTDALNLLNINGRIAVITFHSLEDKICQNTFKKVSLIPKELNKLPIIPEDMLPKYKIVGNVSPSKEEIERNVRARSAKLRVIERVR